MAVLNFGVIGASVWAGTNGDPITEMAAKLTASGNTVTVTNRAISATDTSTWAPGSGNLTAAKTAFAAAGATMIIIGGDLATNDAKTARGPLSTSTHRTAFAAIVTDLVASGYQVLINRPTWMGYPNDGEWSSTVNAVLTSYFAAELTLVDGVQVFVGDPGAAFAYTQVNAGTVFAGDNVHFNSATNLALGDLWAAGILYRLGFAVQTISVTPPNGSYSGGFVRTPARALPSVVAAPPSVWLDASNLTTTYTDTALTTHAITDGASVLGLRDALGSSKSLIQATAGNAPTIVAAKANGRAMLGFGGTNQLLMAPAGSTFGNIFREGTPFTMRLVAMVSNIANGPRGIIGVAPDTSFSTDRPGSAVFLDEGSVLAAAFHTTGGDSKQTISGIASNTIFHWVIRSDGTTWRIRTVAGGADSTTTFPATNAASLPIFYVGGLAGLPWPFNGWFGEVALWPGSATSAEADALLTEAQTWWGS